MNEPMRAEPVPDLLYPEPHEAAAVLEILEGPGGPPRRIRIRERLEIGRLDPGAVPREARLLLADPLVSRFHCVLRREDEGTWILRDASRNGTILDDRRLVPGVEIALRPGQVIRVGDDWRLRFLPDES